MTTTWSDLPRKAQWAIKWRWKRFRRWINPTDMRVKLFLSNALDEDATFPKSTYGISRIHTLATAQKVTVTITLSRPGLIIGRRGAYLEELRQRLEKFLGREVFISIREFDPFGY